MENLVSLYYELRNPNSQKIDECNKKILLFYSNPECVDVLFQILQQHPCEYIKKQAAIGLRLIIQNAQQDEMIKDISYKIWKFCLKYSNSISAENSNLLEILAVPFSLSFSLLGSPNELFQLFIHEFGNEAHQHIFSIYFYEIFTKLSPEQVMSNISVFNQIIDSFIQQNNPIVFKFMEALNGNLQISHENILSDFLNLNYPKIEGFFLQILLSGNIIQLNIALEKILKTDPDIRNSDIPIFRPSIVFYPIFQKLHSPIIDEESQQSNKELSALTKNKLILLLSKLLEENIYLLKKGIDGRLIISSQDFPDITNFFYDFSIQIFQEMLTQESDDPSELTIMNEIYQSLLLLFPANDLFNFVSNKITEAIQLLSNENCLDVFYSMLLLLFNAFSVRPESFKQKIPDIFNLLINSLSIGSYGRDLAISFIVENLEYFKSMIITQAEQILTTIFSLEPKAPNCFFFLEKILHSIPNLDLFFQVSVEYLLPVFNSLFYTDSSSFSPQVYQYSLAALSALVVNSPEKASEAYEMIWSIFQRSSQIEYLKSVNLELLSSMIIHKRFPQILDSLSQFLPYIMFTISSDDYSNSTAIVAAIRCMEHLIAEYPEHLQKIVPALFQIIVDRTSFDWKSKVNQSSYLYPFLPVFVFDILPSFINLLSLLVGYYGSFFISNLDLLQIVININFKEFTLSNNSVSSISLMMNILSLNIQPSLLIPGYVSLLMSFNELDFESAGHFVFGIVFLLKCYLKPLYVEKTRDPKFEIQDFFEDYWEEFISNIFFVIQENFDKINDCFSCSSEPIRFFKKGINTAFSILPPEKVMNLISEHLPVLQEFYLTSKLRPFSLSIFRHFFSLSSTLNNESLIRIFNELCLNCISTISENLDVEQSIASASFLASVFLSHPETTVHYMSKVIEIMNNLIEQNIIQQSLSDKFLSIFNSIDQIEPLPDSLYLKVLNLMPAHNKKYYDKYGIDMIQKRIETSSPELLKIYGQILIQIIVEDKTKTIFMKSHEKQEWVISTINKICAMFSNNINEQVKNPQLFIETIKKFNEEKK